MGIPHVGDIGTLISLDVGEDISAATVAKLAIKKPSGATEVWTGSVNATAIEYTVIAADLDEAGDWDVQGYVETPAWSGYSTIATMTVGERLGDASI